MAKKTVVLQAGEGHTISGVEVTVIKCGMHKEGDSPARPTVTLEYDDLDEMAKADLPEVEAGEQDTDVIE